MSLHPQEIPPIPEETMRVARAAFPCGNIYMRMRDELGTIYEDYLFAQLFPPRGQPAASPWRLALTTVMQFAEGLSDRSGGPPDRPGRPPFGPIATNVRRGRGMTSRRS
jgi:transposase